MCFALCSSWLCCESSMDRVQQHQLFSWAGSQQLPILSGEHWHTPHVLTHFCSCGAVSLSSARVRGFGSSGSVWIKHHLHSAVTLHCSKSCFPQHCAGNGLVKTTLKWALLYSVIPDRLHPSVHSAAAGAAIQGSSHSQSLSVSHSHSLTGCGKRIFPFSYSSPLWKLYKAC